MASFVFIFDPKIVKKGKHKKIVPSFYIPSTWEGTLIGMVQASVSQNL